VHLTHLGHACLLVEVGAGRILLDPGTLAPGFEAVTGLDAILITHQHVDHVDLERLPGLVAANPGALRLAEPETVAELDRSGLAFDALAAGEERRVGPATVRAVGGPHALIHEEIPRIGNVGLLVSAPGEPTLFHPGDAYEVAPEGVDVLALPLSAPWAAGRDTVAFLRAVAPRLAFPIHDGLLAGPGRQVYLGLVQRLAPERTRVQDLAGAGSTRV
jgi:L-ascorbate metabolism protein UlaG (beta-lactamase superfamily)